MDRCPYCAQPLEIVQVHGHGQCATCHTNIQPCCSGEMLEAAIPLSREEAGERRCALMRNGTDGTEVSGSASDCPD